MPITDIWQLHGAAARTPSTGGHVISFYHRHGRFQSQKPFLDSSPSLDYLYKQPNHAFTLGGEATRSGQAGQPADALEPRLGSANDRTTISLTMGLPTFEDAPEVLKPYYFDGILTEPRQFIDYALLHRYTTADKYEPGPKVGNFRHRLTLKAPGFSEVEVLGEGKSMVRSIRVLYYSVLTSLTQISAENTAFFHLVSKLFTEGLLQKIYSELGNRPGVAKSPDATNIDRSSMRGQLVDINTKYYMGYI